MSKKSSTIELKSLRKGPRKSLDQILKKKGGVLAKRHKSPGPKFYLALNLLTLRLRQSFTQRQVAEKAGIGFNTYVNIEQAQPNANPTADNLIKLAELFKVKMADLWKE